MTTKNRDVISLAKEARDLAETGCKFDEEGKLGKAIKLYDEAIILMDNILSEIPPNADAWKVMLDLRSQYSNRLEKIRHAEVNMRDVGHTALFPVGKPKRRMSRIPFCYNNGPIDSGHTPPDLPPTFLPRVPFWLLKLLKKVIRGGGFLTDKVYIPKIVWNQDGAKFAGLNIKTPAYEQIIINITSTIYPIEMPVDEHSADIALVALQSLTKEFHHLQNNLSKPFPFIKELSDVSSSGESRSPRPSALNAVGLIGKNVVKYAEAQVQRIGVAILYTKISMDELQSFGNLAAEVCDRCQILDEWIKYVEDERNEILMGVHSKPDALQCDKDVVCARSMENFRDGNMYASKTFLDPVREELHKISAFLRDVVCELLLRDTEQLLERYMIKTRKSFARMYWEGTTEEDTK